MNPVVNWESVNTFLAQRLRQETARHAYATMDVAPIFQGRVQMLLELQNLEHAVATIAAATEPVHG
jgi:Lon protease-like protein